MRWLTLFAFVFLLSQAAGAVDCPIEYLHVTETVPHVPCVHVEGGCEKNTILVSNYCSQGLVVNPGLEGSFTIPPGGVRQEIVLGGLDPTDCIEDCVFFNESLEWERNESCALDCVEVASRYSIMMGVGGVDFMLEGGIVEYETYVNPATVKMRFILQYILPALMILFLLLQWHVYKADKFVFDDYGFRNLLVIAVSAIVYVILMYSAP